MHFWTLVFDNGCPRQILDVFILMINKSENNANITHITTGRIGLLWVLLESLTIVYLRTQSSDLRRIVEFLTLLSNFGRYHLISNSIFRLRISKSAFGRYRLISPKTSLRRHLFVNWNVLLLLETFLFPPKPDRVSLTRTKKWKRVLTFLHKELKTLSSKLDTIWHGLMLLWFKDLMNVTERLQFIGNLVLTTESKT